jgi:hypothetical protein
MVRVSSERRVPSAARRSALARASRDWVPALRYCAVVYLAVRIGLFLLAAAAWGLTSEQQSSMPNGQPLPLTNGWHNALTDWDKLDANWFLYIAQHGYSNTDGTAAFFPGYPMLVRLIGYLCLGHQLLAGYLVSNAALLAALVILYRLTEHEYDLATARRAVLYLALFPTAVFLFGLYSESLFLLAAVGAFYLARRGRWWWAGVVGIAATATRSMGVIVALALAVEAIHQTVEDRRSRAEDASIRRLAGGAVLRLGASVLPLAGIAGYLLFWQLRYHDWSRPITLEKTWWQRQFTAPWLTLWHGLRLAAQTGLAGLRLRTRRGRAGAGCLGRRARAPGLCRLRLGQHPAVPVRSMARAAAVERPALPRGAVPAGMAARQARPAGRLARGRSRRPGGVNGDRLLVVPDHHGGLLTGGF